MGGRTSRGDTRPVPPTVLVVDDDDAFRRVVVRLLRLRGLEVVADVGDGEAALAAARRHRPDGVLLDVNLPDHSGICVARTVTAGTGGPAVVLTSTDPTGFTAVALAECGARAFVPKDRLTRVDLRSLLSAAGT
jgi:two-component system nitrate/nitrite response regulator NarL